MTPAKWVEIFVVVIVLGSIAWLGTSVYELNSSVSRVDVVIQDTAARLDRIANVLPDMRVRIAEEELRKRPYFAVFCENPKIFSDNKWKMDIKVLDFHTGTRRNFQLALSSSGDNKADLLRYTLRGANLGPSRIALAEALDWVALTSPASTDLGRVDPHCSYISSDFDPERYNLTLHEYEHVLTVAAADEIERDELNTDYSDLRSLILNIKSAVGEVD